MNETLPTWRWLAPEVINITSEIYDERSDIYSFGIICYELASLSIPFEEYDNQYQYIRLKNEIIYNELRPTIPNDTPPLFQSLIYHCWRSAPDDRYTCNQIISTLCSLLNYPPSYYQLNIERNLSSLSDHSIIRNLILQSSSSSSSSLSSSSSSHPPLHISASTKLSENISSSSSSSSVVGSGGYNKVEGGGRSPRGISSISHDNGSNNSGYDNYCISSSIIIPHCYEDDNDDTTMVISHDRHLPPRPENNNNNAAASASQSPVSCLLQVHSTIWIGLYNGMYLLIIIIFIIICQ